MADYTSQFTGSEIDARLAKVPQIEAGLAQKQDTLESGVNIKTINQQSILGSGNIQTGSGDAVQYTEQNLTDAQKTQARTNIGAASLSDINNTEYVTVTTLPTANAATVGPIYLVGPDANNNYDRYFTQESGGAYSWVPLGSTQIVLSTYATHEEVSQLEAKVDELVVDVNNTDLDIADEDGDVLVRFVDGNIKVKNFDSTGVNEKLDTIEDGAEPNDVETMDMGNVDYCVADENGQIIVLFKDGHIKTKYFDSSKGGAKKMRILGIGNSYTCDAFNYVGPLLAEVLAEHQLELHIGICYQGGATITDHYNNISNNSNYTFYEWTNNGPSWAKSTKAINTILALDEWDVIFLQQGVYTSDDYSTYQPMLNNIFDMISERINYTTKFGFNLVRALSTDPSVFPDYIANAEKLLRETLVQFVIPCGTACQNARTTSLDALGDGGHLTYDGFHLQDGLPCLVEAYAATMFVLSLFGFTQKGINGSAFRPTQSWTDSHGMNGQANGSCTGVTEANVVLAKKCATVAVNNPFVVTDCSNLF